MCGFGSVSRLARTLTADNDSVVVESVEMPSSILNDPPLVDIQPSCRMSSRHYSTLPLKAATTETKKA